MTPPYLMTSRRKTPAGEKVQRRISMRRMQPEFTAVLRQHRRQMRYVRARARSRFTLLSLALFSNNNPERQIVPVMTARGYQDTDTERLTVSPATYGRRECVMNISSPVSVCGRHGGQKLLQIQPMRRLSIYPSSFLSARQ